MLHESTLGHNHNVIHAEYSDRRRAPGDSKCWPEVVCRNVGQRETDIRTMLALTH